MKINIWRCEWDTCCWARCQTSSQVCEIMFRLKQRLSSDTLRTSIDIPVCFSNNFFTLRLHIHRKIQGTLAPWRHFLSKYREERIIWDHCSVTTTQGVWCCDHDRGPQHKGMPRQVSQCHQSLGSWMLVLEIFFSLILQDSFFYSGPPKTSNRTVSDNNIFICWCSDICLYPFHNKYRKCSSEDNLF